MSNNDTFKMTYSSKEKAEIDSIRSKYTETKVDGLTRLRALDAESEAKAKVVSLTIGIIGILVFGTAMSLYLSELGAFLGKYTIVVSIIVGIVGIIIMAYAFPAYTHTLHKEREKRKEEILALSDELLNNL